MIRKVGFFSVLVALVSLAAHAAIVVVAPAAGGDQADIDADWATRSTDALYAENFDYASSSALRSAFPGIGGTAANVTLETTHTLSGKGARITTPASFGASVGSIQSYMNGTDATEYSQFFFQAVIYNDEHFLNYPFKQSGGDDTSPKFFIIDQWNSSANPGEIVLQNRNNRGFVTSYGGKNTFDPHNEPIAGSLTPCPNGDPDGFWQGMIDRGTPDPADTCAKFKQRYGPLSYNLSGTTTAGTLLDQQGTPDPDAAIGGLVWKKDGATVIEVYVDVPNQRVMIWGADYGDEPLLLVDTNELTGFTQFGQTAGQYNGFQLTTFRTNGIADETNRVDTYTTYQEVITKLSSPIPFPNPGGTPFPVPSPPAPTWATDLTVDAWTALSTTNTFQSVQASDVGQYGNTGPDTVFTSSSGAAHIPTLGGFGSILHAGAGHLDYYGNEVYRFDLDTLTWSRISEPSTANGGSWGTPKTNGLLTDGTPHMPHTYYWLNGRDGKLVLGARQTDDQPAYASQVSIFDPVAGTWSTSTATPDAGFSVSDQHPMVIDTSRDVMWAIDPDVLEWASYDFDADSWTTYQSNASAYATGNTAVYVPTKDAVILFAESPGTQVIGLDPSSPSDPGNNETLLTTSGTAPAFTGGSMAHWSSNLGAIVYYPSRSDEIHLLTPPAGDWKTGTWAWSERTLTGNSGIHDGSAGTYNKFQVIEWGSVTVATVIGDVDGSYRAVRLQ